MKTLQLSRFGAPTEVVELVEVDPTDPGAGQLVVSIEAAPINPSDLNLIRGVYGVRPDLPAALGAEGVGRVIAVGDGVDRSRVGTRVLIIPTLQQATWRGQTVVDEGSAVAVGLDGDPLQLAMLGVNPATAYCLLHGYVELAAGAWVAQTGASSATAGYVLALAKHAGLRTLNVVRRAESVAPLRAAGADVVLVEGPDLTERAAAAVGDASLELINRRRRRGARRAARVALEDRGPDHQLHRSRAGSGEHPGGGSHLPWPERSRILAEPLAGKDAARDDRADLSQAQRAGRRRHARRSRRGDVRARGLPGGHCPCRPERPYRQGALRSPMSAGRTIAGVLRSGDEGG